MKKKISIALAAFAFALLLVVGSVAGTFAYLTSTAEVTNTFTVGNIEIDMDETDVTVYGVKETDDRVKTNEYKLIPGHTYTKDPTVTVKAGSEACYLFVKIENGISGLEVAAADTDNDTIAEQIVSNDWTPLASQDGVYYKKLNATANDTDYVVFSTFTLADNADVASYADVNGDVSSVINIFAYAIQADGLATEAAAWTALGN